MCFLQSVSCSRSNKMWLAWLRVSWRKRVIALTRHYCMMGRAGWSVGIGGWSNVGGKERRMGSVFCSATGRDGSVKQVYSVLAATLSTKGISAKGTIFMTGLFNLTGSWASLDTHCWRIVLNNSELLHDVERFLQEWKNATCLILSAAGDLNDSVRQLCLQDYFAHL